MIIDGDDNELYHYGIKRRSGRYPWGSGQTPEQRSTRFQAMVKELRAQGNMSESEIAKALGFESTTQLRAAISIAGAVKKAADIAQAERLKESGMSVTAIAREMYGDPKKESTVRGLLAPGVKDRADVLTATSEMLKNRVDESGFVDIGKGVENYLGISPTKLSTAAAILEAEGYTVHSVPIPQVGRGQDTKTKVLCPPGTEWKDVMQNRDKIVGFQEFSPDGGRNWNVIQPPLAVSSKRLKVRYAEEGGDTADGVIYIRPGAKDLDMGGAKYAQVRILIDGTHYIKGMAVLKDDLPAGVDMLFNSNKTSTGNKLDALKPVNRDKDGNVDKENPFGSSIHRQIQDDKGRVKSALNLVNEDATWDDWSRNLASQMLSKQKPDLIKERLDETYSRKKEQLDEILSLNNPTVRERLLRSYADDMDASAVHLKAAAMPRQKTHVLLPINSLRENEVYAPNYKNGDSVVLIRYPHGGKFEIPELTVNNRNPEGRKLLGSDAKTAIGINHKVAGRLSGADFDGDTVVVIPNNNKRISTESPLEGLKNFDPQRAYPGVPGMKKMTNTQTEMGMISNLITDMTIKGAGPDEIAAAVRHSMVVIDAEKKGLNYRQSAIDNGITNLRRKYQKGPQGGASTLISRTTGPLEVPDFKARPMSEGGPINRKTGELVYVPTGKTYNKKVTDPKTGEVTWVPTPSTKKVQRGLLNKDLTPVSDARKLIDGPGTIQERMYADYANKVKGLANKARLEMVNNTQRIPYSPSAKKAYAKEVASLNAKLNKALKNAPLERQAQVVANAQIKLKRQAHPEMDADQVKKLTSQEIKRARARVGADKDQVEISDNEWKAIQAGAITQHKLKSILDNANVDHVKKLATPRKAILMSPTKVQRAKSLAAAGYTQAEIAEELGVSLTTLKEGLK